MLRRVVLVRTDVSEEHIASIITATIIGEIGTSEVTSNRRTLRRNAMCSVRRLLVTANVVPSTPIITLIMKALHPPKRRFLQESHCVIPDGNIDSHRRENLKSYIY
jgi:hypothetical protein